MVERIKKTLEYENMNIICNLFRDAHWEVISEYRSPVSHRLMASVDCLLRYDNSNIGVVEIKMVNSFDFHSVMGAIEQTRHYYKLLNVEFALMCINNCFYFVIEDDELPLIQVNEFPVPEIYRFLLAGNKLSVQDVLQRINTVEDSKDERLIELWKNMQYYLKRMNAIVDK